jgi:hypothetical protein
MTIGMCIAVALVGVIAMHCAIAEGRMTYPPNWPRCPSCGDYALDGHITCGRVECNEGEQRRRRQREHQRAQRNEHAIIKEQT